MQWLIRFEQVVVNYHPLVIVAIGGERGREGEGREREGWNCPLCYAINTNVPLLYCANIWGHSLPEPASLLATITLMGSITDIGERSFHRLGLLLPLVVSMVTWKQCMSTAI